MRAFAYIDGFNLYYGIGGRRGHHRWLDLRKLAEALLPRAEIGRIRYFTTVVERRETDPAKIARQETFLRALRTLDGLEIHYGTFVTEKRWLKLVRERGNARVYQTNEKGSDVNLGSHLLLDAFRDRYDVAVIISSDRDLITPIKMVQSEFKKDVIIANPQLGHKLHDDLLAAVPIDGVRTIRESVLRACRLPDELTDDQGAFGPPEGW